MTSGPLITVAAGASAQDIQAVVDAAPPFSTILLEEGSYSFSQSVVVARDDLTISGAPGGRTMITTQSSMGTDPAFQLGSGLHLESMGPPAAFAASMAGATGLRMTAAHDLKVGDVVWIEAANDAALFREIGDSLWRQDKPLRTTMAVVTSVDGQLVTLDRPLPRSFPSGATIAKIETADGLCLRDLTLQGPFSAADPSDFSNRRPDASGAAMVVANATTDLRLENVTIINPLSHGVVLGKSLDASIDGLSVSGAQNKGDGGNGYGLMLRDVYDGDFRNLTLIDMRHAVLFASYTSASGNEVRVSFTNRDINFHGGLDIGNTVFVDRSVRSPLEAAYLGAVSFVNSGTSYGAPTDPKANSIVFGEVAGTVRADLVFADNFGTRIETFGGADTVTGGGGSDYIDLGTGDDRAVVSAGSDTIIGGFGRDSVVVNAMAGERILTDLDGQLLILSFDGRSVLSGVETVLFYDRAISLPVGPLTPVLTPVALGTMSYDRVVRSDSVVMGSMLEAVTLTGSAAASVLANGLNNNIIGNDGANFVLASGGDDRVFGGLGNDSLSGGEGQDLLNGGAGNDVLDGGGGTDILTGRQGSDRFHASGGTNYVTDFSSSQEDTFVFAGESQGDVVDAVATWLDSGVEPVGYDIAIVQYEGKSGLSITDSDGDNLVLLGVSAQQFIADYGDL